MACYLSGTGRLYPRLRVSIDPDSGDGMWNVLAVCTRVFDKPNGEVFSRIHLRAPHCACQISGG